MHPRARFGPDYPGAPPQYPQAWDPVAMQIIRAQIVREVSAESLLGFGILGLTFFPAPIFGLVIPIVVLAFLPMARRRADFYAAYFPEGFPNYRAIGITKVLSILAVCLSAAMHVVYISWTLWLRSRGTLG